MSKKQAANKVARGYARDEKDEKRLRAAGVKTIYRADNGETLDRVNMRAGEFLGVVDGLRALAPHRVAMSNAVARIHKMKATVIDVETGLQSREDGVEMLRRALAPKGMPADRAAEMQALAAKTRVKDGRMAKDRMVRIWRDDRYDLDEFEEMTGWPRSTAYLQFGPRFKRKIKR